MDDDVTRSLVDQHIREYDMRLRRLDELLERAKKKIGPPAPPAEARIQLESLKQERDKLAGWLEQTRSKPLENWREEEIRQAGPMGIWDAVAQQVEKLVERMER